MQDPPCSLLHWFELNIHWKEINKDLKAQCSDGLGNSGINWMQCKLYKQMGTMCTLNTQRPRVRSTCLKTHTTTFSKRFKSPGLIQTLSKGSRSLSFSSYPLWLFKAQLETHLIPHVGSLVSFTHPLCKHLMRLITPVTPENHPGRRIFSLNLIR